MDLHALRDGTEVEIRPIRADDGERLRASHTRLSPESRYRRFLAAKPALSPADIRYLVEVDGADHFALVATVTAGHRGNDAGAIVGVARFIRALEDRAAAELAIVVADRHQRQGLAAALLHRLVEAAQDRGIDRFRATMLTDNLAIRRLLERVSPGELVERSRSAAVTEVEVELATRGGDHRVGAAAMIAGCAGS